MYQVQVSKGKSAYKVKAETRGHSKAVRKYSRVSAQYNSRIVDTSTGEVIRRKRAAA